MTNDDSLSNLTGQLLIAMPGMSDPRFHHGVVFICAHDPNGTMGLVINQPLPGLHLKDFMDQLQLEVSGLTIPDSPSLSMPVYGGGPVEGQRGFLLHSGDYRQQDTVVIGDEYGVTGTVEAIKALATEKGPARALFILGYAGWGAGQLEEELKQNSWLIVEPEPDIVFHANPEEKWALAYQQIGINPGLISREAGSA